MKKIIALIATIATAATLTSCQYIQPGIYQAEGQAASETSFIINNQVYRIYADRLQPGETYIIILSDNASPLELKDDEILNYYDLETWELMHMEKE